MKSFYFLFASSFLFITAIVAQPKIIGQVDIGGTGNDDLTQLCHTTDGELLAAGSSTSMKSAYKSHGSKGDFDYWIVKSSYDKTTGKTYEKWDKTIGGDSTDLLYAAVPTRDGGFILAGNSLSGKSGDKTSANLGGYDLWIVKVNSNGEVVWDKTIGTGGNDYLASLDSTNDGGCIFLYNHESTTGSSTLLALMKLDAAGNITWKKDTLNSSNIAFYHTIHSTTDGGYLFAADSADKQVMIKTDANLNEQWKTSFANIGYDPNVDARELKDGSYMFFATKAISYGDDGTGEYYFDYYFNMYKTDHSGKLLWSLNQYQDYNGGGKVIFDEPGNGGYFYSYFIRTVDLSYEYPVRKIDTNGNLKWVDSVRSNPNGILKDIKEVKGGTYVYGYLSSAGIGADKTKKNLGFFDYWLVEVRDTTMNNNATLLAGKMASTPLQKEEVFSVYPNPVSSQLHVQVTGTATLSLINESGKTVIQQVVENSSYINVAKVPAGLYYLKNETTGTTKKVIITK